MEATAKQTYIIMSPRKIRRVINTIRGKQVPEAFYMLSLMPYEAARIVLKKLKEATANAQVKYGADPTQMVISEVYADEGPAYRRFKPRAQGRIYRREKPTSHLTLKVKVQAS